MTMKFLFATGASLFFTTGAFAKSIREHVLVPISNPEIVVKAFPNEAPAQPIAFLKFSHASCVSQMPLRAQVAKVDNQLRVAIVMDKGAIDCMGPAFNRNYQLQISSNYQHENISLSNPLVPKIPNPVTPRFCTQNAGILIHNETGICRGFSNGCQEDAMLASGYRYREEGECE